MDVDLNGAAVLELDGGTLAFKSGYGWGDLNNTSGTADSLTIRGTGAVVKGTFAVKNSSITVDAGTALAGSFAATSGSFVGQTELSFGSLSLSVANSVIGDKLQVKDSLELLGGSLTLDGTAEVLGGLNMSGGQLDGKGTLLLKGLGSRWTGGTMTGGGTTEIAAGAILTIGDRNNSIVGLGDRRLLNRGAIVDLGSSGYGMAVDLNGAAVLELDDGTLAFKSGYGWGDYGNNSGTADSLTVRGKGTIAEGTLALKNSAMFIQDGTSLAGTVDWSSGSLSIDGSVSLGSLKVSGGTVFARGDVEVTGGFDMSGGVLDGNGNWVLDGATNSWTGGIMSGAGSTIVNHSMTLLGDGGLISLDSGRRLENRGSMVWRDGFIEMNAGHGTGAGLFVNAVGANFEIQASSAYSILATSRGASDSGSGAIFTNFGKLRKKSDGTSLFNCDFVDLGEVIVERGRIVVSRTGKVYE